MNKIQKNITKIQQKFTSLKAAYELHKLPIPITQVAEIVTYGVIRENHVQDFLKYVQSSPDIQARQKINQKWYELDFTQMVTFLDKVTFHQNQDKIHNSVTKSNQGLSPYKRKIKVPTSQAHQNPFIPAKITPSIKNSPEKSLNSVQSVRLSNKINLQNVVNQGQKEGYYSSLLLMKSKSLKEPQVHSSASDSKVKQIIWDLPDNFQNLSPNERYAILSQKYGKDKTILQKKFDTIYKHYRKEMFIPFQSFQINNQLLMDLRIFLKYYREFQVSNTFKTNDAIQHFKKIALNGLWLDDKNFMEIHYKLIDLFKINETMSIEENNNNLLDKGQKDVEKANEMKLEIPKGIKQLVDNIVKIKEFSDVVSEDKMKQVFNNKERSNVVKKIVQAHSGLTKDDVMLKLHQRIELRKLKKNSKCANTKKSSPNKRNTQISKILEDPTERLSPKKQSIYDELQIPKLRSRQLKKSSVYSSLQLMDIHKEKEKLKLLINQRQNEQYLKAFFKKQKLIFNLPRTKSVSLHKYPTENQESTNSFTVKSTKSIKNLSNQIILKRNFSLPRMKFN